MINSRTVEELMVVRDSRVKIADIECCLKRIHEGYNVDKADFKKNYARQDSVILNLERASQATIDIATHIMHIKNRAVVTIVKRHLSGFETYIAEIFTDLVQESLQGRDASG